MQFNSEEFKQTLSDHIAEILKTNLPTGIFKQWYNGLPELVPEINMPYVAIFRTQTDYLSTNTAYDTLTHRITIRLVFNKKSEFGKNSEEVVLQRTLEQITEGRKKDGTFQEFSVVGILRKKFTLEGYVFNNELSVRYDQDRDRTDTITIYSQLDCTFHEDQFIGPRL